MRVTIVMNQDGDELRRRALRATFYAFLAIGIIALGYAGYTAMDRYWFQGVETAKFESASAPVEVRALEPAAIAEGGVIGEVEAPRLGLKAIVVQGDSEKLLQRAVGHLTETAMPGEGGNVALAGHRDGLFRPLRNVRPGDVIIFKTPEREFQYEVEWTAVVAPTAVGVLQPTSQPALTLVTCFPFYYVGAAPERFVVRARITSVAPRSLSTP
jgi:sortase A